MGDLRASGALYGRKVMQERYAGNYVRPVIVPTDPGNERYDGKDVSPVRIARTDPVSTFSVDVGDIGAGHQVTAIYEIVPAGARGWNDPHRYAPVAAPGDARGGELAFVKLRYKLPNGTTSRLIERPVAASLMRTAARPSGDFAFATAVAAFGQRLRGDALLQGYSHAQIAALAGRQGDFWRQEFARLVGLAKSLAAGDRGVEPERAGG